MIGCFENLDPTRIRNPREARPKLAIIIPKKVFRLLSICCGFPKLLCSPSIGGRSCNADVDHSPRLQFDHEESEKRTEEKVSDWEKVAGPNLFGMMVQEGGPVLSSLSRCASAPHVLLNGLLAHVNAQLEQFATDPLRTPESILLCHFFDQRHCLFRDFRLRRTCSGFVLPEQPKSLAMPPEERLWLDNEKRLFPGPNHPSQQHQEDPICLHACWSFDLSAQNDKRLS